MPGIRTLVVDDEPVILKLITAMLEGQKFNVTTAPSGKTALELLASKKQAFDVILSDVMMPSMDGMEFARRIRESNIRIPILFMSGYALEWDRELGAPVIHKPFTPSALISAIQALLSGNRTSSAGR